ncbi:MAG: endonuclease/exonuclease/phosphatase family protein [Ruminococcaceae bacterium]|nr:endonuclease/exonuclease/phosphatase family protein [Oscillospiraceae bacterium]
MRYKRIGFIVAAFTLLILMFTACCRNADMEMSAGTESTWDTAVPTADSSDAPECISLEELNLYTIVCPEQASKALSMAEDYLRNKILVKCGVELKTESDAVSEDDLPLNIPECEILLGVCDREESRQFFGDMKISDYGYAMIGKKLVICGGSEEATVQAIYAFIDSVVQQYDTASETFYCNTDSFLHRGTYEIETLTVQGNDISEYAVVYPDQNTFCKNLAAEFVERILSSTGILLTIGSDAKEPSGKEILIGTTNRSDCAGMTCTIETGAYQIGAEGNYIYARGAEGIGDYSAVYALIDSFLDPADLNRQVVLEAAEIKEVPMEDTLKAMSFNIYYTSLTQDRKESVRQTILRFLPDTVGLQEATPEWMKYLQASMGDIYDSVGLGRDGGANGEHSAILYRKDRFDLIETGTKWMSETPDEVSKFEESSLNRIFTYAILSDKKSGTEIMVVNTHLEHTSSAARERQVGVLLDFLENYTQYPIVLTGDFNASPESNVYRTVTAALADSSEIAETAERRSTYHNYGKSAARIDYAFVSSENIEVLHYRVITEKMNGMLPSDHYALLIEYDVLP